MKRYEMGYSPETGDADMVPFEYGEWCKFWEAKKIRTQEDIREAARQLKAAGFEAKCPGRPMLGAKPTLVAELCTRLGLSDRHVRRALNHESYPNPSPALRAQVEQLRAERDAAMARVAELLDCGQDGACARPGGHGGCLRHWEERTRELGDDVLALRARVAELEAHEP